jgi:hypothetical protein
MKLWVNLHHYLSRLRTFIYVLAVYKIKLMH